MPIALPVALAVVVASAWIASGIARSAPPANSAGSGPMPSKPEEDFD
jgi:hypothetical protein